MEQLQKLNINLISILDNYFDINIWTDIQWTLIDKIDPILFQLFSFIK